MKHNKSIEDLLSETQAPRIVESDHRKRLKNQLIQEYRKEKTTMIRWMASNQKIAWALGLFLMTFVVTSSWAGYKILSTYFEEINVSHEINVIDEATGDVTSTVQVNTLETISVDPNSTPADSNPDENDVNTTHTINIIDEKTGEVSSTVRIESTERISTSKDNTSSESKDD